MDKWEQVAREIVSDNMPSNWAGSEHARKALLSALRQCEADTIRRCLGIIKGNVGNGDGFSESYESGYDAACEDIETDVLALLPKEVGE